MRPIVTTDRANTPIGYVGLDNNYNASISGSLSTTGPILANNISCSMITASLVLYDPGLGKYVTITSNNGILTVT